MTGGTYMHIHSYQIHNVLNFYRNQLSRGLGGHGHDNQGQTPAAADRIKISMEGQRQSLVDKISAEIVERITRSGPETPFEKVLADRIMGSSDAGTRQADQGATSVQHATAFTYTVIDEHNQKKTNTLSAQPLQPPSAPSDGSSGVQDCGAAVSGMK
jgi:hypothetical protein